MVAIFVFLMLRLTPGDPASFIAGDNATAAQIAEIREKLGLQPSRSSSSLPIWVGNLLRGDLGELFFFKADVTELIGQRVGLTLALATVTMLISDRWSRCRSGSSPPTGTAPGSTAWSWASR